jgi:RNA polymerase sigma factor (sigma-70 family)
LPPEHQDLYNRIHQIHQSLLDGEPTASEALARECLMPLVRILRRRHLDVPRDILIDAASDALLSLIQLPDRFDPKRSGLLTFLATVAERRLIDHLRAASRQAAREIYAGSAQELQDRTRDIVCADARSCYAESAAAEALSEVLETMIAEALPDPKDREILRLICEGRQSVEDFAALLGVDGLPPVEQRRAIKRSRDRVLNRLRRRREAFRRAWSDDDG